MKTLALEGFHSGPARNMRVHHECWIFFLKNWVKESRHPRLVLFGDGEARMCRHHIGTILGDQQVYISYHIFYIFYIHDNILHIMILHFQESDEMTCEPHPFCHRCPARVLEFLRTELPVATKIMSVRQDEITEKAFGDGLQARGMRSVVPSSVVDWDEDCSNVRPGPNARHY